MADPAAARPSGVQPPPSLKVSVAPADPPDPGGASPTWAATAGMQYYAGPTSPDADCLSPTLRRGGPSQQQLVRRFSSMLVSNERGSGRGRQSNATRNRGVVAICRRCRDEVTGKDDADHTLDLVKAHPHTESLRKSLLQLSQACTDWEAKSHVWDMTENVLRGKLQSRKRVVDSIRKTLVQDVVALKEQLFLNKEGYDCDSWVSPEATFLDLAQILESSDNDSTHEFERLAKMLKAESETEKERLRQRHETELAQRDALLAEKCKELTDERAVHQIERAELNQEVQKVKQKAEEDLAAERARLEEIREEAVTQARAELGERQQEAIRQNDALKKEISERDGEILDLQQLLQDSQDEMGSMRNALEKRLEAVVQDAEETKKLHQIAMARERLELQNQIQELKDEISGFADEREALRREKQLLESQSASVKARLQAAELSMQQASSKTQEAEEASRRLQEQLDETTAELEATKAEHRKVATELAGHAEEAAKRRKDMMEDLQHWRNAVDEVQEKLDFERSKHAALIEENTALSLKCRDHKYASIGASAAGAQLEDAHAAHKQKVQGLRDALEDRERRIKLLADRLEEANRGRTAAERLVTVLRRMHTQTTDAELQAEIDQLEQEAGVSKGVATAAVKFRRGSRSSTGSAPGKKPASVLRRGPHGSGTHSASPATPPPESLQPQRAGTAALVSSGLPTPGAEGEADATGTSGDSGGEPLMRRPTADAGEWTEYMQTPSEPGLTATVPASAPRSQQKTRKSGQGAQRMFQSKSSGEAKRKQQPQRQQGRSKSSDSTSSPTPAAGGSAGEQASPAAQDPGRPSEEDAVARLIAVGGSSGEGPNGEAAADFSNRVGDGAAERTFEEKGTQTVIDLMPGSPVDGAVPHFAPFSARPPRPVTPPTGGRARPSTPPLAGQRRSPSPDIAPVGSPARATVDIDSIATSGTSSTERRQLQQQLQQLEMHAMIVDSRIEETAARLGASPEARPALSRHTVPCSRSISVASPGPAMLTPSSPLSAAAPGPGTGAKQQPPPLQDWGHGPAYSQLHLSGHDTPARSLMPHPALTSLHPPPAQPVASLLLALATASSAKTAAQAAAVRTAEDASCGVPSATLRPHPVTPAPFPQRTAERSEAAGAAWAVGKGVWAALERDAGQFTIFELIEARAYALLEYLAQQRTVAADGAALAASSPVQRPPLLDQVNAALEEARGKGTIHSMAPIQAGSDLPLADPSPPPAPCGQRGSPVKQRCKDRARLEGIRAPQCQAALSVSELSLPDAASSAETAAVALAAPCTGLWGPDPADPARKASSAKPEGEQLTLDQLQGVVPSSCITYAVTAAQGQPGLVHKPQDGSLLSPRVIYRSGFTAARVLRAMPHSSPLARYNTKPPAQPPRPSSAAERTPAGSGAAPPRPASAPGLRRPMTAPPQRTAAPQQAPAAPDDSSSTSSSAPSLSPVHSPARGDVTAALARKLARSLNLLQPEQDPDTTLLPLESPRGRRVGGRPILKDAAQESADKGEKAPPALRPHMTATAAEWHEALFSLTRSSRAARARPATAPLSRSPSGPSGAAAGPPSSTSGEAPRGEPSRRADYGQRRAETALARLRGASPTPRDHKAHHIALPKRWEAPGKQYGHSPRRDARLPAPAPR
eukprot:TRINITY_DN2479_c0_g1_i1.p1 TRINITY_DN2479_c0_g1~~TRINITY_DN2479_c0_g1_i1.p1  ORF type:complete len:1664 (+),score=404.13 TRINITY_DN2479_c0_g1_i1:79-4992(+)